MSEYADLKYAKKLVAMFPDAKEFYETRYMSDNWKEEQDIHICNKCKKELLNDDAGHSFYPCIDILMALTVLPNEISKVPDYKDDDEKEIYFLEVHASNKGYKVMYIHYYYEPMDYIGLGLDDKYLVNALCKLIIHLKKEGLLK